MRPLTLLILLCLILSATASAQDPSSTALDAILSDFAPEEGYAMVIGVWHEGETAFAATGFFDVTEARATQVTDRFRIASVSKTFLAVVLLQLQAEGALALDDLAKSWLETDHPDMVARLANMQSVTLRDLAAMTSGIPDYLDDDFFDAVLDDPTYPWSAAEVLTFAYDEPAEFAVGRRFEYSNTNYVLLQLVIEAVTGQSLAQVLRERIFDPLEMRDTYTQISETLPNGFVHGYADLDLDGTIEDVTDVNDGAGLGDGALVSTAADLFRFYEALLIEKTLLDAASLEQLLSDTETDGYGLGIEVFQEADYGTLIGHTGAVEGFLSAIFYAPDLDAMAVALMATSETELEFEALLTLFDLGTQGD